jgi:hypothetical protein
MSLPDSGFWAKMAGSPAFSRFDCFSCSQELSLAMFSDQIEKLKHEYTDKYVLVDQSRPELARFRDVVGRVKTVNMNGQALVEFDDYNLNIGWYDIAPEYLKVVDQPPPKAPKVEKKPAAKAEAKPAAKAPAAKAPVAAKPAAKGSVADILAAARAGKSAPAKPAGETAKAEKPAAKAPAAAGGAPAKADRSKMSVADMLAAARAGGAGIEKPPAVAPKAAEPETAEEPAEAPAAAPAATPTASGEIKPVDKSKMTIEQIIAYCREHDSK